MSDRPSIVKLDHVTVHVTDLEQACRFYEDVLGWESVGAVERLRDKGIVWYELPDGRQIHLYLTDTELPLNRAHFALYVEDVSSWRAFFVSKGVAIVEPLVVLKKAERFFVRDPSANLIEFVQRFE